MNLNDKTIWQQASGDKDRNYSDICLKWDVILNGPGYAGKWPDCIKKLKEDRRSKRKITDLKRFCEEIKGGDIVVLRLGTTDVFGVGIIVGTYDWVDEFSDVDGWDLQHVRRVKWIWKDKDNPKKFPVHTLKQGDTTQKLKSEKVINWIKTLDFDNTLINNPVEIQKSENNNISLESISEYLFDQGVASNSIENLIKEIDELTRIAKWYTKLGNPSEHETRAYLVIPLLRALGWTPQKMAIEWKNMDVALFTQLPRDKKNLTAIVEFKKKDKSCLTAMSQAESYAEGKPNCKRLIVTDGLRYGVFIRKNDKYDLHAYMNLTNMRDDYPIYDCKGIKAALRAMTLEWDEFELQFERDKK